MASADATGWEMDPSIPHTEPTVPKDSEADLLSKPFAKANLDMGYDGGDILQTIKTMKKHQGPLTASALMGKLMELESRGKVQAPLRPNLKRPADDRFGSDGESQDGFLEEDGEAGKMSVVGKMEGREPREPPQKKASLGRGGKEQGDLRLKLQVLREENRRLKTRQLCRSCWVKPVAITFLPCGHFSFCYECGQEFHACPLCQKTILADVRTFLA